MRQGAKSGALSRMPLGASVFATKFPRRRTRTRKNNARVRCPVLSVPWARFGSVGPSKAATGPSSNGRTDMKNIVARTGVTALLALVAAAISVPQTQAATISVDCDPPASETIDGVLDAAAEDDVIKVSGTCNEAVSIRKDRIRLDGLGGAEGLGGAKIIVPSGTGDSAVSIRGDFVTIEGFSAIIGDRHGISVGGSNATIRDNTIKDSVRHTIILTSNASANIINNLITNSGFHGIRVSRGANARIGDNTVTQSAGNGIQLSVAASGEIFGNTVTDNGRHGISVSQNAGVRLSGGPPGTGNPNVLERNGRSGLSCSTGGSLDIDTAQVFGTGADANATGDTSITETCVITGDAAESLAEFKPEKLIKK